MGHASLKFTRLRLAGPPSNINHGSKWNSQLQLLALQVRFTRNERLFIWPPAAWLNASI